MKRTPRFLFWAAILPVVSGCGLSDYQSRMDKERERVQQFDDVNKLLDEPIDVPYTLIPGAKEEAKTWPFDVFLRLPKGYGVKDKDKRPYGREYFDKGERKIFPFFFRYAGGSEGAYGIFIAAASVAEPKQKETNFGEYTTDNFSLAIKPSLENYCQDVLKQIPPSLQLKSKPESKEIKQFTPYPDLPGVRRIPYTFFTFTDEGNKQLNAQQHSAFDVYLYVHERTARQICIVVHRPMHSNLATLKPAVEACLGTLDLGDAVNKRAEYKKAKSG
jgi:hypothetical protein